MQFGLYMVWMFKTAYNSALYTDWSLDQISTMKDATKEVIVCPRQR